jgi:cyclophilin family peptidyl-prolyl cis-trans isomerase
MSRTTGTYAIFNTSEGTIVCRLFEQDAPKTVTNFIELAEGSREWTHPVSHNKSNDKLYDGTIFHRVIPDFMIQGYGECRTEHEWFAVLHYRRAHTMAHRQPYDLRRGSGGSGYSRQDFQSRPRRAGQAEDSRGH